MHSLTINIQYVHWFNTEIYISVQKQSRIKKNEWSTTGGETDLQALQHPNKKGLFPRGVITLKLHCGDYVFLYFF